MSNTRLELFKTALSGVTIIIAACAFLGFTAITAALGERYNYWGNIFDVYSSEEVIWFGGKLLFPWLAWDILIIVCFAWLLVLLLTTVLDVKGRTFVYYLLILISIGTMIFLLALVEHERITELVGQRFGHLGSLSDILFGVVIAIVILQFGEFDVSKQLPSGLIVMTAVVVSATYLGILGTVIGRHGSLPGHQPLARVFMVRGSDSPPQTEFVSIHESFLITSRSGSSIVTLEFIPLSSVSSIQVLHGVSGRQDEVVVEPGVVQKFTIILVWSLLLALCILRVVRWKRNAMVETETEAR